MDSKGPGLDDIRIVDIKKNIQVLAGPLTRLVNMSLKNAKVPSELKKALIRPIFKSGSHYSFSNYRPISILSSINKILERYIADNLIKHLENNNIICDSQYAYQKGKGTNELLAEFSDYVNNELGLGNQLLIVFIDFSKAFDTLKHEKIEIVLEKSGIRGKYKTWFMDYLREREVKVKINDTYSKSEFLKYGVPQGSILGPLIYLLYVNDMPSMVQKSKIYMYADDTVLVTSNKSIKEAEKDIQSDFLTITKWCHDNGLSINGDKSKVMHIHSPYYTSITPRIIHHSYDCLHLKGYNRADCDCQIIKEEKNFKYLGIIVDHTFKWDVHIRKITDKLRVCAAKFYYLRQYLPYHTMKLIYSSMCESLLRYGLRSWGNASESTLKQLQAVQTRVLRVMSKLDSAVVERASMICYQLTDTLLVEKLFKFLLICDYYFSTKFKIRNEHRYNSRKCFYLVPRINNKYSKRTRKYLVPTLFNDLPSNLAQLTNYNSVKAQLKKLFIAN